MKYTKYLSAILSAQGVPNMDQKQFGKIMNAVHLEARLSLLKALKEKALKSSEPYRYDIDYHTNDEKLTEITKNLDPKEFFERLLQDKAI